MQTDAGTVVPEVMVDQSGRVTAIAVDMGPPVLTCRDIPFVSDNDTAIEESMDLGDGRAVTVTAVGMGNPMPWCLWKICPKWMWPLRDGT